MIYSNELTLAAILLNKIENLQYEILRIPRREFHYPSIVDNCPDLSLIIYRNQNRDKLVFENFGTFALRISLVLKCLA